MIYEALSPPPPGAPTLARHLTSVINLLWAEVRGGCRYGDSEEAPHIINAAVAALAALPRYDADTRDIDGVTHYRDREGAWRPAGSIKPEHLLQDELARTIYGGAVSVNASMARFKGQSLSEIQAYLDLLTERYGAKPVALEDGVSPIRSLDGRFEISVKPNRKIVPTPEITAAKSLLDEWLDETNAGEPLAGIVRDAFGLGEGGCLRVSELLRLQRRNVDHPKWVMAMDLLRRGMEVICDGITLRCYQRVNGEMVMVPLRMSRV